MKQKDIVVLVTIGVISAVIAYVIAGTLFKSPSGQTTTVSIVQPINPTFPQVKDDKKFQAIFNSNALDPTQLIQITQNQNNTPFNASQN